MCVLSVGLHNFLSCIIPQTSDLARACQLCLFEELHMSQALLVKAFFIFIFVFRNIFQEWKAEGVL